MPSNSYGAFRTPLVFLPGLICDDALWQQQADALRDVASTSIADLTLDDSVEAMAARTLMAAPEKFALAALSMGGYVAFEIMRQAPERVTHLALFDTSASPDSEERKAKRTSGIASLQIGQFRGVTNRLLPQLIHLPKARPGVEEALKDMAMRVGQDAFMRQQTAILGRPDSRPVLSTITIPTLVAVGDQDVLTPLSEAVEIYEGIPAAHFHVFSECGHLPALEQPEETIQLLRAWLSSNY